MRLKWWYDFVTRWCCFSGLPHFILKLHSKEIFCKRIHFLSVPPPHKKCRFIYIYSAIFMRFKAMFHLECYACSFTFCQGSHFGNTIPINTNICQHVTDRVSNWCMYPHCPILAVQQKMSEEIGARMRAESRVVEVEKQCSMLEFDLKQSVQKMEQLMKQKERLEDEASTPCFNYSCMNTPSDSICACFCTQSHFCDALSL